MQRRRALGAAGPWQEIHIDGIRIAYDDVGQGPAILCLHTAGHGSSDFRPLAAQLRQQFRIVAVDWPGHGNSGCDSVPVSSFRYAYLLARLVEMLGLDRPLLIGHGIGADAALRLAAQDPDCAGGLVLVNPLSIVAPHRGVQRRRRKMMRLLAAAGRGSRWSKPLLAAQYWRLLRSPAAVAQRRRIVAATAECAPILLQAWQSLDAPEADLTGFGPFVRCPVLFAWASRDRFAPLHRALPAIGRFPCARVKRFAAYAPQFETPEAFAASVARFARAPRTRDAQNAFEITTPSARCAAAGWG